MTDNRKSSEGVKDQLAYDGGTIRGGVVKPSSRPAPRPPAPTGQGGSGKTTNQGGTGSKQ